MLRRGIRGGRIPSPCHWMTHPEFSSMRLTKGAQYRATLYSIAG